MRKRYVYLECWGEALGEDFGLRELMLPEPSEEAYFLFSVRNTLSLTFFSLFWSILS